MKTVVRLNKWANARTSLLIDFLRIATGLFLVFKGIQFSSQTDILTDVLGSAGNSLGASFILIHYVAMSHLFGGALIVFGLLTRLSLLVQLPILIGAVIINFTGDMIVGNMMQASLVLISAVFFIIYGSGKHSVDYSIKMNM